MVTNSILISVSIFMCSFENKMFTYLIFKILLTQLKFMRDRKYFLEKENSRAYKQDV